MGPSKVCNEMHNKRGEGEDIILLTAYSIHGDEIAEEA
jgi:hypothetical protein